ncbi:MAG: sulfite exporter TauE/SafE family protein, partial [Alphaproteobacteria bacterium]|nr:sulfite exporter TauE/SafE family protein [Alphaproteobacteria bacterium]
RLAEVKGLAVGLLALGAVVFLAQALALLGLIGTGRGGPGAFGRGLAAIAGPLAARQGPFARFGLGAALGFLPCGLLYGALAVAGGGGTAPAGALAMAAFGLGTVPSLMGVGVGGAFLAAKRPRYLVPLGAAILIADAVVLAVLAYGAAVG